MVVGGSCSCVPRCTTHRAALNSLLSATVTFLAASFLPRPPDGQPLRFARVDMDDAPHASSVSPHELPMLRASVCTVCRGWRLCWCDETTNLNFPWRLAEETIAETRPHASSTKACSPVADGALARPAAAAAARAAAAALELGLVLLKLLGVHLPHTTASRDVSHSDSPSAVRPRAPHHVHHRGASQGPVAGAEARSKREQGRRRLSSHLELGHDEDHDEREDNHEAVRALDKAPHVHRLALLHSVASRCTRHTNRNTRRSRVSSRMQAGGVRPSSAVVSLSLADDWR